MAFIAVRTLPDGTAQTLGVVRAVIDPDNVDAEFAIIVRSDLKGQGLGHLLLRKMIDFLAGRGTQRMVAYVLRENEAMRELARSQGFAVDCGRLGCGRAVFRAGAARSLLIEDLRSPCPGKLAVSMPPRGSSGAETRAWPHAAVRCASLRSGLAAAPTFPAEPRAGQPAVSPETTTGRAGAVQSAPISTLTCAVALRASALRS